MTLHWRGLQLTECIWTDMEMSTRSDPGTQTLETSLVKLAYLLINNAVLASTITDYVAFVKFSISFYIIYSCLSYFL